jgi:transposase
MVQPVTVGLDIAKNVFHAYGVDAQGEKALSRKLRRAQVEAFFAKLEPCLVGIEACATAHHWARTIEKLGHRVRLMPPAYVKPYVKSQKNDEADAEAICEAVTRPNMRFAEVKSVEQQSVLVLHRTRAMLIKHRTRMSNTIRAHLAEFGITETIGREGLSRLIDMMVSILKRWQGASREDIEAWRPLPAVASRRRRSCGDPICTAARHTSSLAAQTSAAAHAQDRRSGYSQQDGAGRLGADGTWRHLS